jgi:superfamily II DNA or RNA helicase
MNNPVTQLRLYFDKGTICIEGTDLIRIPNTKFDDRTKTFRSYGLHYKDIKEYLQKSDLDFIDNVPTFFPISSALKIRNLKLRDYQNKAIQNWINASMRGCIVLPTGAGKTTLGIKAIETINASTLIIVPTIDLMDQWEASLTKYLYSDDDNSKNIKIGKLGGGDDDLQPITIATYDSAYLRASLIGNQFKFVIFDEVHHLPAPGYRLIAEHLIAPYRLGLTATIEREDELHDLIPSLTGGIVFRLGPQDLSKQKHLAEFTIEQRQVVLTPTEQKEYDANYGTFLTNLKKLGFVTPSMYNFKRLIMMSNRNRNARDALLARNKANEIALNSVSKVIELQKILKDNPQTKTIIFTQNNKMVYEISNKFLIPCITYRTIKDERRDIINGFKSGLYNAVVTSRVLDEGVDIPDAELGIILSGTGSGRELVQRLGRLLRPKHDGRKAKLIEIISKHTRETRTSAKRITALNKNITNTVSAKRQHQFDE